MRIYSLLISDEYAMEKYSVAVYSSVEKLWNEGIVPSSDLGRDENLYLDDPDDKARLPVTELLLKRRLRDEDELYVYRNNDWDWVFQIRRHDGL